MEKSIKELIFMIMEILLLSVLLLFVRALAAPAQKLNNSMEDNKVVNRMLTEYRDLYLFDDKYVTGDDILNLMQVKKNRYTYYIDTKADSTMQFIKVASDFEKAFTGYVNSDGVELSAWDTEILTNELLLNKNASGTSKQTNVYYAVLCRLTPTDAEYLYGMNFYTKNLGLSGNVSTVMCRPTWPSWLLGYNGTSSALRKHLWNENENATNNVGCVFFIRNDAEYNADKIKSKVTR